MKNVVVGAWSAIDWYGRVTFDGKELLPDGSLKLANHSPDGFAWGYNGSGPAQLALAILLAAGVPPQLALRLYQRFKAEHVAKGDPDAPFRLELDVLAWARAAAEVAA